MEQLQKVLEDIAESLRALLSFHEEEEENRQEIKKAIKADIIRRIRMLTS